MMQAEADRVRGDHGRVPDGAPRVSSPRFFPVVSVVAMGVLAHWPLLRLRGTFWDDWVLLNSPGLEIFQLSGRVEFVFIHRLVLLASDPIRVARLAQFGFWLVAAILLLRCLQRLPGVSTRTAAVAACTFAVLPTYSARVTLIMLPSTVAFVVFLAFWLILLKTPPQRLSLVRGSLLVSMLCVAYSLLSLLVFVVLPFAIWLWMHGGPRTVWRSVGSRMALTTLLISPIVYYLIRTAFLVPTGPFVGYNSFSAWNALVAAAVFLIKSPDVLSDVFLAGYYVSGAAVVLMAAAVVGLVPTARLPGSADPGGTDSVSERSATYGIAALVAGVAPYLLVGKLPVDTDWSSRHQILLSIGIAILFAFAACRVLGSRPWLLRSGAAVVLSSMIVSCWGTYAEHAVDAARQVALQNALHDNEELRDARLIALELDDELVDARQREPRYYEASHLVRDALKISRRDLLVLFSDPANTSSKYEFQPQSPVPFPSDFLGLATVDVTRPLDCASVAIETQPRARVTTQTLPKTLVRGVAEIPQFAIRRIRHGCESDEIEYLFSSRGRL